MVQKTRETSRNNNEDEEIVDTKAKAVQTAGPAAVENADVEGLDKLLGEIDDVLEENAQGFVEQFVQKGGQ